MRKKLLQTLENQAHGYYEKKTKVSFDDTTGLIVKNINWSEISDFDTELSVLSVEDKSLDRLNYYYNKILKEVSLSTSVDLSKGEYIDFWQHLDKNGLKKYLYKFYNSKVDEKNLFNFLSILKSNIRKRKFVVNFKIKSIEMLEVKKGFING